MTSGFRMKLGPGEMTPREAIKAVRDERLKRRPFTEAAVDQTIDEIMARLVEREFGPRCEEFEPDCPTCQAWANLGRARP